MPTRNKLTFNIATMLPGSQAMFTVARGNTRKTLSATLAQAPRSKAIANRDAAQDAVALQLGLEVKELTNRHRFEARLPSSMSGVVISKAEFQGKPMPKVSAGDVLLQINGTVVATLADTQKSFKDLPKGRAVMMKLWRNGSQAFATVEKL